MIIHSAVQSSARTPFTMPFCLQTLRQRLIQQSSFTNWEKREKNWYKAHRQELYRCENCKQIKEGKTHNCLQMMYEYLEPKWREQVKLKVFTMSLY